jgi:hypothetical protein
LKLRADGVRNLLTSNKYLSAMHLIKIIIKNDKKYNSMKEMIRLFPIIIAVTEKTWNMLFEFPDMLMIDTKRMLNLVKYLKVEFNEALVPLISEIF